MALCGDNRCNRLFNDISVLLIMKTKALILLVVLCLFTITADAQCAMCRAVLESEESGEAAKGINNGIVYLMIFPYLLIGGIGYVIYRTKRNVKNE